MIDVLWVAGEEPISNSGPYTAKWSSPCGEKVFAKTRLLKKKTSKSIVFVQAGGGGK